ncbi:hypothetical protein LAY41_26725 [Argonema galeatum A003/A1]|nr:MULTISPECIES: hypothetical protein [Argonema]MCL1467983.1 hypothetical protein [Argonema galeatum A003/A1]MCL1475392.1 hypothetical protein [Argonema antarcticum A004/B2]
MQDKFGQIPPDPTAVGLGDNDLAAVTPMASYNSGKTCGYKGFGDSDDRH